MRLRGTRAVVTATAAQVVRTARGVLGGSIPDRAASLAYYAFLAIPATLLIALGVFGLVVDEADVQSLVQRASPVLPPEAITLLNDSLSNVAASRGNGVTLILVSLPVALWSATGAMTALMRAMNEIHGTAESRSFVRQRLVALAMLAWSLFAALLVVGMLILGPVLSRWIGEAVEQPGMVSTLWWTLQWPVLIVGLLLAFAGIMYLGPDLEHRRWTLLSAGALVSTALWIVISGGFALYASRFGSYNATWGSLSVVVVTLVWLWLSGIALLLGAQLNAEMRRRRTS